MTAERQGSEVLLDRPGIGRLIALAAGPLALFLITWFTPPGLTPDGARVLGVAAWMTVWWLTGPIPLGATALLPLVLFPLLGVASPREAATPYANEFIFLFLAGFMLAAALEHWNAHARVAYAIVGGVGTAGGRRVVFGVMLSTAFISLWISNTATTAMMYPIALAVGALFGATKDADNLRTALMLGVAYAASIGGMGTLIGTPPNLIFAGAARDLAGVQIDFVSFMAIGLPAVAILLPLCWLLLMAIFPGRVTFTEDAREALRVRRAALGPLKGGERAALWIFGLTAVAWIAREPKDFGAFRIPGLTDLVAGLNDASVGLIGALAMFIIIARAPDGTLRPVLTWTEARRIPWEVLLIYGGGFSFATAMETKGVAAWLGNLMTGFAGWPTIGIFFGVALIILLLTELASNTTVAAMAMPIVASLADAVGQPRLILMLLTTLVASAGFALPTATAPNIIVFGSGTITVRQMVRAGLLLDVVAVVVIVLIVLLLGPRFG
ncbi:MAG TPA: DASS family sodium-coupled anion symporter [Gemmatimonadaceae bacterium]|nr:DASS family sodium-coupled anion symporter [Gemmatimonadaceae bacterium]